VHRAGRITFFRRLDRSSGSTTSLSDSPISDSPSTSSTIAVPGKIAVHQMPDAISGNALLS
jgi:hypothetical protein